MKIHPFYTNGLNFLEKLVDGLTMAFSEFCGRAGVTLSVKIALAIA